MGRLTNEILGLVSGKVGNIIFRIKDNTSYTYAMPKKVRISQRPQSKRARSKFTPLSNFASYINSIPELKFFWKNADIKAGSAYHKISKSNYSGFLFNRPTIQNNIVPNHSEYMLEFPFVEATIDQSGIKIKGFIENIRLNLLDEIGRISAIAVICFYNPIKRRAKYFILDKLVNENTEIKFDEPFEIRLPYTEKALNNYYLYKNSIFYITLLIKDAEGNPIRFMKNHNYEIVHEFSEEERKTQDKIYRNNLRKRIQEECSGYMKRLFSRQGK
jgi:hypothetical protein